MERRDTSNTGDTTHSCDLQFLMSPALAARKRVCPAWILIHIEYRRHVGTQKHS